MRRGRPHAARWWRGLAPIVAALFLPTGLASAQAVAPVCNVAQAPVHGCVMTFVDSPGSVGSGTVRTKEGRACASNFLRLVAIGDMRISTAKQRAGITQVSSVDFETTELISYWGVYSRICTVVRGD